MINTIIKKRKLVHLTRNVQLTCICSLAIALQSGYLHRRDDSDERQNELILRLHTIIIFLIHGITGFHPAQKFGGGGGGGGGGWGGGLNMEWTYLTRSGT